MNTKKMPACDLVDTEEFDTLVASNRERSLLPITGEVYESWAMPGMVGIETPFGTMYVDKDELMEVVVND